MILRYWGISYLEKWQNIHCAVFIYFLQCRRLQKYCYSPYAGIKSQVRGCHRTAKNNCLYSPKSPHTPFYRIPSIFNLQNHFNIYVQLQRQNMTWYKLGSNSSNILVTYRYAYCLHLKQMMSSSYFSV